jgi:hypothetical protein
VLAGVDARYQKRKPAGLAGIRNRRRRLSVSPQEAVNLATAYIHESFELNTYAWRLLAALLRRWRDEADAIGAQLKILLLPVSLVAGDPEFIVGGDLTLRFETPTGPFTFRAAEPGDRLRTICERLGIELIDPTQAFANTVRTQHLEKVIWPSARDEHFSAIGHRILADWLADDLARPPR